MTVCCVGLNHQSAPMGLLEKVSLDQEELERLLVELMDSGGLEECVGLCTCNRIEFYLAADSIIDAAEMVIEHLLRGLCPTDAGRLRDAFYLHGGANAVRHVFRVAAGVDSLVIGEAQILGQLHNAFNKARSLATSGEELEPLLQAAIAFGRRVRTETSIGRGNLSVASIACRLAVETFGSLANKRVLLIGAGDTARLAGRHFVKEGVAGIQVLNRTRPRAEALAQELGGEALGCWRLRDAIQHADIVVCATGSPHHIVTRELLMDLPPRSSGQPILFVDLSMPRNVEPGVALLPGVSLHAMDSLEEISKATRANRETEVARVERLVAKETRRFMEWAASSRQNQAAATLRRYISSIQDRLAERHLAGKEPAVREQIERFANSLLRAAFHDVTEYIRSIDPDSVEGRRDLRTIERLFGLADASCSGLLEKERTAAAETGIIRSEEQRQYAEASAG